MKQTDTESKRSAGQRINTLQILLINTPSITFLSQWMRLNLVQMRIWVIWSRANSSDNVGLFDLWAKKSMYAISIRTNEPWPPNGSGTACLISTRIYSVNCWPLDEQLNLHGLQMSYRCLNEAQETFLCNMSRKDAGIFWPRSSKLLKLCGFSALSETFVGFVIEQTSSVSNSATHLLANQLYRFENWLMAEKFKGPVLFYWCFLLSFQSSSHIEKASKRLDECLLLVHSRYLSVSLTHPRNDQRRFTVTQFGWNQASLTEQDTHHKCVFPEFGQSEYQDSEKRPHVKTYAAMLSRACPIGFLAVASLFSTSQELPCPST